MIHIGHAYLFQAPVLLAEILASMEDCAISRIPQKESKIKSSLPVTAVDVKAYTGVVYVK